MDTTRTRFVIAALCYPPDVSCFALFRDIDHRHQVAAGLDQDAAKVVEQVELV